MPRYFPHMPIDLSGVAGDGSISDAELISGFATLMAAMRTRGIIRTKNVVGDLGEWYAKHIYSTLGPRGPIFLLKTNNRDVDAKDASGSTYSIKAASLSSTRTSAFNFSKDHVASYRIFDYLVVVRVDDSFQLHSVYEFSWDKFWSLKRWNVRQKAWFLPLTKLAFASGSTVFSKLGCH